MTTAAKRLKALMRRKAGVKAAVAALREEEKRQKKIKRKMAASVHALIGTALVADLERAEGKSGKARLMVISEILDRHYPKGGARQLLIAEGWIYRAEAKEGDTEPSPTGEMGWNTDTPKHSAVPSVAASEFASTSACIRR
jgi:hypothetical protein